MLDNLFKSFDGLLKEKHSLSAKADQLARNERQLVEKLSRALAGSSGVATRTWWPRLCSTKKCP